MKNLKIRLWKPNVKTSCCGIYENCPIWEQGEFEKKKKIDNLRGSHQPKMNKYIRGLIRFS
jgi:hypothetical protein